MGESGAPQTGAPSILSANTLHCIRNHLLKKAVLFITLDHKLEKDSAETKKGEMRV